MVILVTGGRDYADADRINEILTDIVARADDPGSVVFVHGDARGADRLAGAWAKERGFAVHEVPADWNTHGTVAGPLRNQQMIDRFKPDCGVAFPGGRGTEDCLLRLFRAGVPTMVVGR